MSDTETKDVISSSLSSPIKELFTDIADMGLDKIIDKIIKEQELLKDVPVIKWLFIGNEIRNVLQGAFFLQKYANFIGPINKFIQDKSLDSNKLNDIFSDKKTFSKIIDQTIISLDKYQTIQKAKILGILFVETFINNNFSIKEYNTLIFSLEFIHPYLGIECLKSFYDYKCEMTNAENTKIKDDIWAKNCSLDYSPLAITGLLNLPIGGTYCDNLGGATINGLGYKFYELVVSKL